MQAHWKVNNNINASNNISGLEYQYKQQQLIRSLHASCSVAVMPPNLSH